MYDFEGEQDLRSPIQVVRVKDAPQLVTIRGQIKGPAGADLRRIEIILVKIDSIGDEGGIEFEKTHRPDPSGGIPWYSIQDAVRSTLVTSDGANGNIGFPGGDEMSTDYLIDMLRKTRHAITDDELQRLRGSLVE